MFTCFLIVTIPPTVVNGVVPKFFTNMALWQAREYPSRIYGWAAFCTANIVSDIPAAVVSAVLYFVLWYWPTGLPTESSVSGYCFLMTLLMFLFMTSWGQWICAFAPSFTVISNVSLIMIYSHRCMQNANIDQLGPAILLRHVWLVQRSGSPLRLAPSLLEVLDVLCKPLYILDWRHACSNSRWCSGGVFV
jgi:hypothetical protein